jgi:hypothetical protein
MRWEVMRSEVFLHPGLRINTTQIICKCLDKTLRISFFNRSSHGFNCK